MEICSIALAESNLKEPFLAVLWLILIWCDSTNFVEESFPNYMGKKDQSVQQY